MPEISPIYQLLSASTAAELSELVNQHLRDGFEVLGAPFSSPAGTVALLQAVIKYSEAEPAAIPAPSRKTGARAAASLPFHPKSGGG